LPAAEPLEFFGVGLEGGLDDSFGNVGVGEPRSVLLEVVGDFVVVQVGRESSVASVGV
jgi:hypothetical protein